MRKVKTGGGWPALFYSLRKARQVGGMWKFFQALRSRNACKTCALGMGGQNGGMVNEHGSFPEICKKGMQAMAADMQGAIPADFWSTYSLAQLQCFTPLQLETAGRLVTPLRLGPGEQYYQPITWEAALEGIAGQLRAITPDETFWYFSGRSSNEAAFLLQLFARLYGTNNVNNCSFYCHQASGVGLNSVLGTGTATVTLSDLEHADLVFIIGGNPASNHPRMMSSLKHVRRRGGEVIVINPVVETGMVNFSIPSDPISLLFGTRIATLYVQPDIGGDLALLLGIAKRIVELQAHDEGFLAKYAEGWPQLKAHLAALDWEQITQASGVPRAQLEDMAARYARARNVVFCWTMGITHHVHGVQNVEAIANLALLRGMVGRPGAGLLPIRGHSNVQGIGSVGVTPQLKDAIFQRLQTHYGVQLPTTPGRDTMSCMDGAATGQLKLGVCLGGNLYGSNPDAVAAAKAIANLHTMVYLSTTLNTGHAHGVARETFILPVLARDEESQKTTQESMFNFIRLSDGGPRRHAGPRSETELVAELADRVLRQSGPIVWRDLQSTSRIRKMLADVIPGWEEIRDIDAKGRRGEFFIPGRTFHTPTFPTPSGKAALRVHDIPARITGDLVLMTVRSEGQFNTVVYEEYDLYRGIDRRDVVLLHPDDVRRLGLQEDQRVTVRSDTGHMPGIRVRTFEQIKAGNALMYYPEANILVPRTLDGRSKTPAFKAIPITIEAMETAAVV